MVAQLLTSALLVAVPFVAQTKDSCGAASLAMVLRYWGQPASQDEIAAEILEPELHGIRGSRLADLARRRGLAAYAYEGDLDHLREYLKKGRPLVVAWDMKHGRFHNVVVVGLDDDRRQVLVNDPAVGPAQRVAMGTFEKRWAGSGHWTLLVVPESQ